MISWYDSCCCEQAREYYFDYLESSSRRGIPSGILTHLSACPDCQGQVYRLRDMMAGPAPSESMDPQEYRDALMTDLLQHHFAYIEIPVSCSMAKPFLPGLADPDLEIRVPTPITVHLDRCMACREDLAALREYTLRGGQLHRIGRFLGRKSTFEAPLLCTEMSEAMISIGNLCFEGIRPEVLTHMCVCPTCRDYVFQYRARLQTTLEGKRPHAEREFHCKGISEADLLDYVLPYELDTQADPHGRFHQSLCEHVQRCLRCLSTIQQLHQRIFGMAGRSDSGVVTTFSLSAVPAEEVAAMGIEDSKADSPPVRAWPFQAQERQSNRMREKTARRGRILRILKTRPVIKAVAAILLITIGVLIIIPAAKAVSLSGLVHALEKTRNVHITTFAADDTRPLQEQWLSRDLDQSLMRQRQQVVLWDGAGKMRKSIDLASGVVESWPLPRAMWSKMKARFMAGMLPFEGPGSIPASAQWGSIDSTSENRSEQDVYELRWTAPKNQAMEILRKWRVTVDKKTHLPTRGEYYIKRDPDPDYSLETTVIYEYLTRDQMKAAIAACMNLSSRSVEIRP